VGSQVRVQPRTGVLKQDVVHERDRRRRSLDIEQDDADAVLAKTERHAGIDGGKYVGPKQTG